MLHEFPMPENASHTPIIGYNYRNNTSKMDSSTVLFVGTLVVAFVFMRWLVSPVPQHIVDPDDVPTLANRANRASRPQETPATNANQRGPREITDSMIEVVQSIAPQLSVGQIRMDLERSGSVEATIERFMETGSLPVPPAEQAQAQARAAQEQAAEAAAAHSKTGSLKTPNLIERYGLGGKVGSVNGTSSSGNSWAASKDVRNSLLSQKREEMILNARRRLESQLKNEVEMPLK